MLALLLTVALSLAASGGADAPKNAGPCPEDAVCELPPAPAPILLRVTLEGYSEDGCSQSSASSNEAVTVTLEVGPTDETTLRVERTSRTVTGPSLGE